MGITPAARIGLLCLLLPSTCVAVDLATIERKIREEPEYQTQPRYCLLVFGPTAESKTWLVIDGKRLYLDRNGNGRYDPPHPLQ